MKVIIAGSRNMDPYLSPLIAEAVKASGFNVSEEVCGDAKGADTLGRFWAEQQGLRVKRFPAEWSKYGRAAGPIRNKQMAEYADALIVFIWNNSRGSANMLDQMSKLDKPCFVIRDGKLPIKR